MPHFAFELNFVLPTLTLEQVFIKMFCTFHFQPMVGQHDSKSIESILNIISGIDFGVFFFKFLSILTEQSIADQSVKSILDLVPRKYQYVPVWKLCYCQSCIYFEFENCIGWKEMGINYFFFYFWFAQLFH